MGRAYLLPMETGKLRRTHVEWTWEEARAHFVRVDPEFVAATQHLPSPQPAPQRTTFESLSRAIMGQQLSTKAAATIWGRFAEHHGGIPSPQLVLDTDADQHRMLGVSGQKHRYLHSLAEEVLASPADFEAVWEWSDEAIIARWTQVKGLGRWTVQMHLMFALNRPDVFPVDDLGIRRAMERHFGLEKDGPKAAYEKRALVWGPFRTAASRLLWRSLDNQPK